MWWTQSSWTSITRNSRTNFRLEQLRQGRIFDPSLHIFVTAIFSRCIKQREQHAKRSTHGQHTKTGLLRTDRRAAQSHRERTSRRLPQTRAQVPSRSESRRQSAEEKFKQIQEAYDVLSDTKKRQMYDQFGHNVPGQGAPPPPGGGYGYGGGGQDVHFDFGGFDFGGGGSGAGQGGQGGGHQLPRPLQPIFPRPGRGRNSAKKNPKPVPTSSSTSTSRLPRRCAAP